MIDLPLLDTVFILATWVGLFFVGRAVGREQERTK
jgi:hypothetical protein